MKKFLLSLFILLISLSPLYAQEKPKNEVTLKATVLTVNEVDCGEMLNDVYGCYTYTVYIDYLEEESETSLSMFENAQSRFKVGDRIYVSNFSLESDQSEWHIVGFARESTIFFIFLMFAVVTIIIGGKQGFTSLLSLGVTFVLLYFFAIPRMLNGGNILLIGIFTVMVSMILAMYVSYGFNKKTTIAVVSTVFGIVIVAFISLLFIALTRLDGLGTDDAFSLLSQTGGTINLSHVYFVSILVGAMGVLDDVVISQISSIYELYDANSSLSSSDLYVKAMRIGKDHISSMVNTLFVAYAGSSLALVMLLSYNNGSFSSILRADSITEEIVRTLAASIGILLVVPVSTFLASRFVPLFKKGS